MAAVTICSDFMLFNMLSRLVITFLPRRKHLLISWLQSLHFFEEVDGRDDRRLSLWHLSDSSVISQESRGGHTQACFKADACEIV